MSAIDPHQRDSAAARPPNGFRVVVTEYPLRTVIAPQGELDLATAPALEAALQARSGVIILDLRGLSFIDASGLRMLLRAETRARRHGFELRLVPGDVMPLVFELTGAASRFTCVESPPG